MMQYKEEMELNPILVFVEKECCLAIHSYSQLKLLWLMKLQNRKKEKIIIRMMAVTI
jgi:hypothetical protein